jgi:hypothetical protein
MREFSKELEQKLVGSSARVTRTGFEWIFEFSTGFAVNVGAIWRLKDAQSIQVTSEDDGHQYGLPAPVDALARGNELLLGCTVSRVSVDDATGDLEAAFSNGIVLEILTNSSGYESWTVFSEGEFWAAVGNGGLR